MAPGVLDRHASVAGSSAATARSLLAGLGPAALGGVLALNPDLVTPDSRRYRSRSPAPSSRAAALSSTIPRSVRADADQPPGRAGLRDRQAGCKKAVIYAGSGVHLSGVHEALAAVAEYLQAGVVESAEGKGAISDHSDLALGAAFWRESPLRAYVDSANVLLAVGSRLALVTFQSGQRITQIDVDQQEIARHHPNTLGLGGDAHATFSCCSSVSARRRLPARLSRPSPLTTR